MVYGAMHYIKDIVRIRCVKVKRLQVTDSPERVRQFSDTFTS